MRDIKFRAKALKTDDWVEGDLAIVNCSIRSRIHKRYCKKYYIVTHHAYGGMLYIGARTQIDPETIISI